MTTQAAFAELVKNPYLWHKAGGSQSARYVYLHRMKKGRYPNTATMEAYLERCPHVKLVQDKKWAVK